jgi:hypothetical protein
MPLVTAANYPAAQVPSVSPSPTPGSDYQQIGGATPEAFGAGVGRAESQLGATAETAARGLESIVIEQQRLTNQVAANQSTNHAMEEATKILHGDPNKPGDVGYFGLKGIDAVNARQPTMKALTDLLDQTRTTLTNPRQQIMFDAETRRMRAIWMEGLGRHYDQQLTQSAINTAKAQETLAANGMSQAWANLDQKEADLHLETAMKAVFEQGHAAGWTQPQIDLELQRLRGTYTAQAVESIATKDPLRARNFLENNKDALVKDEYRRLHGMVDAQADKQQAQEDVYGAAKTVPARSGGLVRGGATSLAMQAAAVDPALEAAVAKRIATTSGLQHWAGLDPKTNKPWNPQLRAAFEAAGLPTSGPISEEQWNRADPLILKYESMGGQNVPNYRFDSTHTAGGPHQITNSTWKAFGGPLEPPKTPSAGLPDTVGSTEPTTALTPVAAKGPQDQILRPLPPREEGQLPDTQVPGLMEKIQDLATKLPPPDTYENQRRWNNAVTLTRKDMNAAYAQQQHEHRIQQEQQKALDDKLERSYTQKLFPPDGSQTTLTATQIANEMGAAGASAASTQRMINFYERQTKPDPAAAVSARNTREIFERMHLPDDSPDKIWNEQPFNDSYIRGELTWNDRERLEKDFRELQSSTDRDLAKHKAELLKRAKSKIIPSSLFGKQGEEFIDAEGEERFARYERLIDNKIKEYRGANKNPDDLFNPGRPADYLGRKEILEDPQFAPTIPQALKDAKPVAPAKVTLETAKTLDDFKTLVRINPGNRDAIIAEAVRRGLVRQRAPEPTVPGR